MVILRLSYKPTDVSYFTDSFSLFNKKVSQFYKIESEKVFLELNLFKNEIIFEVDDIFIKKYGSNIANIKAKKAIVKFKLTNLIQNNIKANTITVMQGGLDIYDVKNFSELNKFGSDNKQYFSNNIIFEKININIYEDDKKVAVITNCNLALNNKMESMQINDLLIDKLTFNNFKTEDSYSIKNLKLINKNKSNYTFKIENIELKNRSSFLKNKYLKNVNSISLDKIMLELDLSSFFTTVRGNIKYKNYINNFNASGTIKRFKKFDGQLVIKIDKFPILELLKKNTFKENKYKINDVSSVLFDGNLTAQIKNNVLEKSAIKVFCNLNEKGIYFINLKNDAKINIEDINFEGQTYKKIYEIKKLNINKKKQNLDISGKLYNNFDSYFLDINANKIEYNNINKFFNNSLNTSKKYFDGISSINIEKIKNLKLNISKDINKTEFNILNSDFENIKLKTSNQMLLNITSAKIIKKNNNIKFYSSRINLEGVLGKSYFSSLSIFSKNHNNLTDNLELKTNISTDYKFLKYILSEFNINQNFPEHLEGNVLGFLKISKIKKDQPARYFFQGSLENFSFDQIDNENIPLVLKDFNGKVTLSNDKTKIRGVGNINGSSSNIEILVNSNHTLTSTITAEAKPTSFNFLGKYNFIQKGDSRLKVFITKNIYSDRWKADFSINLFSSEININTINFHKPLNRRGNISGTLYFNKLDLIEIDSFDFLTEQLLINANLLFKERNELESIVINRFIKDKNNFKANIKLINDEYNLINIEGESIDFKSLMSLGEGRLNNIVLRLKVDNVFYDNLYFGNTFLEGKLIQNKIINLKGNISDNQNIYVKLSNNFDENSKHNIIKIEFEDFGYFLSKTSISDTFLQGKGIVTLRLKNLNLLNGNIEINNSSIKNSSFLARLLQLASFTGLLEILTNEGIPFDKIIVNFTKKKNVINIEEAKFQGFSLGGNLKGFTELDKQKVNLEGIIIPAYAINSLLNKIPLIGQVITGIEGDGLIGVNFKVTGNYYQPNYNVNPLSILTPGIIRSIFDSFFEVNDNISTTD